MTTTLTIGILITATTCMVQFASGQGDLFDDFTERWTHLSQRQRRQATDTTPAFRYYHVTQCGYSREKPSDRSIEIRATANVDDEALVKGARLVYRLVSFIRPAMFQRLTDNIAVGIFRKDVEDPGAFPEYAKTPECDIQGCAGNCSSKCDGFLPVIYKTSHGGRLIVVPAENIACSSGNVERLQNLLVAEFSQALYNYGLSEEYKQLVDTAFSQTPKIWPLRSSTSPVQYFRQATLAWFQSTKMAQIHTFGMNQCGGSSICPTERYSRQNLKTKDIKLYDSLNQIYNYGREYIYGGVTLCDW